MNISICTATYRGAHRMAKLLQSIVDNGFGYYEMLVIDDGSPDADFSMLQDVIRASGLEVKLIRGQRRGWISAINEMVPQSKGDVVLLLDDDVLLPPGLIRVLGQLIETLENVGTLSWRSTGPNPGQSKVARSGLLQPATELAAYCMAFKRSVWDEIGGLDPRYLVYCSDSDFSLRCTFAGHPCYRVWWPLVPHYEHQCAVESPELELNSQAAKDASTFLAKWGKSGGEMEAEALRKLADV